MKCYICGKEASYASQKGREVCDRCFCNSFEKRIRKYIRTSKLFEKKEKVFAEGNVTNFLMKKILGRFVEFTNNPKKADKIVKEISLDDEICSFLENLFEGKLIKSKRKEISILRDSSDEETAKFAKLKGIDFKPNKKNEEIYELIKDISKRHTGSNFTLAKNIELLNRLT